MNNKITSALLVVLLTAVSFLAWQNFKLNKKVELGHLLLITTDQHQLIVDYKIMEKQKFM